MYWNFQIWQFFTNTRTLVWSFSLCLQLEWSHLMRIWPIYNKKAGLHFFGHHCTYECTTQLYPVSTHCYKFYKHKKQWRNILLYFDYFDYFKSNILIRQLPQQWKIKTNIWEHFRNFENLFPMVTKLYLDYFDYFECNILIRQLPRQWQIKSKIWEHFWKFVFKKNSHSNKIIFFPTVLKSSTMDQKLA